MWWREVRTGSSEEVTSPAVHRERCLWVAGTWDTMASWLNGGWFSSWPAFAVSGCYYCLVWIIFYVIWCHLRWHTPSRWSEVVRRIACWCKRKYQSRPFGVFFRAFRQLGVLIAELDAGGRAFHTPVAQPIGWGESGMYVPESVANAAQLDGVAIEYYKSYNASDSQELQWVIWWCPKLWAFFCHFEVDTRNLGESKGGSFHKKKRNLQEVVVQHSFKLPVSSLFYRNLYFLFAFPLKSLLSLTFPLKSLLSLLFSIDISTFFSLFYWNLYFLFSFLLTSLLFVYFSIETSTFSLIYWHPYFLSSLFYWNFSLRSFNFLLKSLVSLFSSIEIFAFSLILNWNFDFLFTFNEHLYYAQHSTQRCCLQLLPPECHAALPHNRAETAPQRASQTTSSCDRVRSDLLWKQGFARFLTFKLAHCPTPATETATSWSNYLLMTRDLNYSSVSLSYSSVSYLLITLQLDFVSLLWATSWWLPLDWTIQLWATSWYWAIKLWTTSWLLHLLTEPSDCP